MSESPVHADQPPTTVPARRRVGTRAQRAPDRRIPGWVYGAALLLVVGLVVLARLALRGAGGPIAYVPATFTGFATQGDTTAPVTVIRYSDFQCPACRAWVLSDAAALAPFIRTGQVHFVFHELPLAQHRNAVLAAEAARCAGDQGHFWPMHDQLYAEQPAWTTHPDPAHVFRAYAATQGLAAALFASCLANHRHHAAIVTAAQAAQAAGITTTPTFVVNGRRADDVVQAVTDALAQRVAMPAR